MRSCAIQIWRMRSAGRGASRNIFHPRMEKASASSDPPPRRLHGLKKNIGSSFCLNRQNAQSSRNCSAGRLLSATRTKFRKRQFLWIWTHCHCCNANGSRRAFLSPLETPSKIYTLRSFAYLRFLESGDSGDCLNSTGVHTPDLVGQAQDENLAVPKWLWILPRLWAT